MRARLIGMALVAWTPSAALAQTAPPTQKTPATEVGEVVVTGQAPAVQTAIDRRSYSLATDLQAQTGSVADALRNLPSVEVDVQGNLSLRGDSNVTILIDGKPSTLFQGDNKGQALQQLPADQIERVEVITNPSAEFRADGSAGVINLITRKAKGVGRTGSLRLTVGDGDRVTASAATGFNSDHLTLSADANYRHDTFKHTIEEVRQSPDPTAGGVDGIDQDQILHMRSDSGTGRVSADYDLSARTRIGGEARANYTDFHLDSLSRFTEQDPLGAPDTVFDRALDIHQRRANGQVAASLKHDFDGEGHKLNLNLSYDVTRDDRVRSGRTSDLEPPAPDAYDQQRLNYDLSRIDLKGDYVRPLSGGATLKAGFDLQVDDNSYDNRGFRGGVPDALAPDPTLTNLFDFRQRLSQAYVTYERPFGDLTVLAGLRVEDVRLDLDQVTLGRKDENNYANAYPSLHLSWTLSETQQLSASYSRRIQRPTPDDYNSFRFLLDPLNYRAGNPHLKPQDTQSFELGYQYRQAPVLYIATLYYRQNDNVVADVITSLGDGAFLTTRQNVSRSRSAGLELAANGRISKSLTYTSSANFYWSELEGQGAGLAPTRSIYNVSGRASLSWQATGRDLFQLSAFRNPQRLTPQGYYAPSMGVDLGYRHKLDDRISVIVNAQDILGSYRERQVIDTPLLTSRLTREPDSRRLVIGVIWTLGSGRQSDPGLDLQAGGGPQP